MRKENNIYVMVAVLCFGLMLFTGTQYIQLRQAYQISEHDKVQYCKEYWKLKCESDSTKKCK